MQSQLRYLHAYFGWPVQVELDEDDYYVMVLTDQGRCPVGSGESIEEAIDSAIAMVNETIAQSN